MTVISIANQKGGVGKTTTTIELAKILCDEGKRVLVVDLDQQGNLSEYSGIKEETNSSIYEVLNADKMIQDVIRKSEIGFSVVPSSAKLSKADRTFVDTDDVYLLDDALKMVEEDYDIVFLDNSPSRNILLTMSYVASDYIIVPTEGDSGSIKGINAVETDLKKLRGGRNSLSHAKILGLILTKKENTVIHDVAIETMKELAEKEIEGTPFVTYVRKSIIVSEIKAEQKSLQQYKKNSGVSRDYQQIAEQILERI